MAVELVFAPEVELDIEEAYQWYEDRRIGLDERTTDLSERSRWLMK